MPYFNPDADGGNWYLQKKRVLQLFKLLKFTAASHGRCRNEVTATEHVRADMGLVAAVDMRMEIKFPVTCDLLVALGGSEPEWLMRGGMWCHRPCPRGPGGLCWANAGGLGDGGAGDALLRQLHHHLLLSSLLFQPRLLSPTSAPIKSSRRASPCRGRSRGPPTAPSTRSSTMRRWALGLGAAPALGGRWEGTYLYAVLL